MDSPVHDCVIACSLFIIQLSGSAPDRYTEQVGYSPRCNCCTCFGRCEGLLARTCAGPAEVCFPGTGVPLPPVMSRAYSWRRACEKTGSNQRMSLSAAALG